MNMVDLYVESAVREMERDSDIKAARYRREWCESAGHVASPARRAVGWTGDRLVGCGERLRSWASPAAGTPSRPVGGLR